jgi:hypothetical protein
MFKRSARIGARVEQSHVSVNVPVRSMCIADSQAENIRIAIQRDPEEGSLSTRVGIVPSHGSFDNGHPGPSSSLNLVRGGGGSAPPAKFLGNGVRWPVKSKLCADDFDGAHAKRPRKRNTDLGQLRLSDLGVEAADVHVAKQHSIPNEGDAPRANS